MTIHDLYSKRNKGLPDVFTYDVISDKIKVQIQYIWDDFFEQLTKELREVIWQGIRIILLKEHGKRELPSKYVNYTDTYDIQVRTYLDWSTDVEVCLDIIELVFKFINNVPTILKNGGYYSTKLSYSPEHAIEHLNTRFLENGLGYEFRENIIIRSDNKLLHKEIIIPTLHFLSSAKYQNANEEYLSAHKHFRHRRTKECLNDSLKALESTLKVICKLNGWKSEKGETAKHLLDLCFQKNLIPAYLANHFAGLRSSLESGVPTLRNKLGGHGQGTEKIEVPMHFASYIMYLSGTSINFLISCQQKFESASSLNLKD
ncbi:hypothetical protein AHMF7605_10280 [Adhaeribacter arboris]|uniref:Abortive infection protein-like C-terminal domain-containing protein n=1 Tax=Adhaeribacter arboris TaxID=2072846 RepID=A0A2T2YED5_9BACT|nr:hypothetical protein [Adhaeribacter arboris]PSR53875.1 hypothetical protein AHMF7605_10280 [Adhaeribacter arboris]